MKIHSILELVDELLEIYDRAFIHFEKEKNQSMIEDIDLQRHICSLYKSGHFRLQHIPALLHRFLALNVSIQKTISNKAHNLLNDLFEINKKIINNLSELKKERDKHLT